MGTSIEISGPTPAEGAPVLVPEALAFVGELVARFGPTRAALLERRRKRDADIAAGRPYDFLAETETADLQKRHVEITGPVTADLYRHIRDDEVRQLAGLPGEAHLPKAIALLDGLVLPDAFVEFLTLPAYEELD